MRMNYYLQCAEFLRALRENPEAREDGYAQAAAYLADVVRADEAYSTSLFQLTARMLVGARRMQAEGYSDGVSFERMTPEQQKELVYASDSNLRELCIIRHEALTEAEYRLRTFWETAVPLYGLQDVPELPRRRIERSDWVNYDVSKSSE